MLPKHLQIISHYLIHQRTGYLNVCIYDKRGPTRQSSATNQRSKIPTSEYFLKLNVAYLQEWITHQSFRMVQITYFHFFIHDLRVITRYFILDLYTTFQYFTTTHTSCPVSPSGPGSPCFPTGPLEKEDKSDHKKTARHEKILHRLLNEVSTYDRRLYQAHIAGCNPKILCP